MFDNFSLEETNSKKQIKQSDKNYGSSWIHVLLSDDFMLTFLFSTVMIHFKCQFDWVKRHPDSWHELFLGVSVKMLLEEIHILMRHSVKKITPFQSQSDQTSSNFLGVKETKTVEGG